ncbi:hypothetical protein Y032_0080g1364 [Ancylostoma ceylanicum]|uniref:Uncharacterized protein n=1 Tax=Ancylostoma ceylanicum TaxID=53326 RepID=A0A016TSN2_9BILA|nr:hypothetical protein Y032_0080g1364 [Ancylostoma ceylanicum]
MPTRVSQYAGHGYGIHFGRRYRLIDFIDFSTFARGRRKTCLLGFSNSLSTNITTILGDVIDSLILSIFPLTFGNG